MTRKALNCVENKYWLPIMLEIWFLITKNNILLWLLLFKLILIAIFTCQSSIWIDLVINLLCYVNVDSSEKQIINKFSKSFNCNEIIEFDHVIWIFVLVNDEKPYWSISINHEIVIDCYRLLYRPLKQKHYALYIIIAPKSLTTWMQWMN